MEEILDDITEGKGNDESLSLLEELAEVVADTSLCGLGKTAPNPVLSALRYFRSEFEDHIHRQEMSCRGLHPAHPVFDFGRRNAPGAVPARRSVRRRRSRVRRKQSHRILAELCSKCGSCKDVCKTSAVMVQ